jgi:hypothetical protein
MSGLRYCEHAVFTRGCRPGFSADYYAPRCELDGVWCSAFVGCQDESCSFCWPDLSRCASVLETEGAGQDRAAAAAACQLVNAAPCEEVLRLQLGECVVSGFAPAYAPRPDFDAGAACFLYSGLQLLFVYDSSGGTCEAGEVVRCDDSAPLGRWAPPLRW